MNEVVVKKLMYKALSPLPETRGLPWYQLQAAFQTTCNESAGDHIELILKIAAELEARSVLRAERTSTGPVFWKMVNFDEWEDEMTKKPSSSTINIHSLNADNVQVGNENKMNIGITAEQFAEAISALANKPPEEAKSIAQKVGSFVKEHGGSLADAAGQLIDLVS